MPFSRLSSPLFVAGTSLLLVSGVTATPIVGNYNDKPTNGYAPRPGVYSLGPWAQFQRNGTSLPTPTGSGLSVNRSTLTVNGALFKDNKNVGLDAYSKSDVAINSGTFQDNKTGLLLDLGSHAVINGGLFANKTTNILVSNRSRIAVNKGSFNCSGDLSNPNPVNNDGQYGKISAGLVLSQGSFGIVNGGTFSGYGSPSSVGVYVTSGASALIKNGAFINIIRPVELYDGNAIISGGQFGIYRGESANNFLNFSTGTFTCSSKLWVTGGTFTGSFTGLTSTIHSGRGGTTLIDGGVFDRNFDQGVVGISSPTSRTQITINGGTFTRNGSPIPPVGTPDRSDINGGVVVGGGTQAVINGGRFQANYPAGVTAVQPSTLMRINNGDFRYNGKSAYPGGPLSGRGAYIHSEANAVINGGNFSNNENGLQLGLVTIPEGQTEAPGATAVINGGIFHDEMNAVFLRNGSRCDIYGGDFRGKHGVFALSLATPNKVRIFGGTFAASEATFFARNNSVIELTGVFDGYDNSRGAIVLPPGQGTVTGQLKLSTKRQKFTYRTSGNGRIILHPTNPRTPPNNSAPSGGSA